MANESGIKRKSGESDERNGRENRWHLAAAAKRGDRGRLRKRKRKIQAAA